MLASQDKLMRKDASIEVKESGILQDHPGFEIGHCPLMAEFDNLRPLGSLEIKSDTTFSGPKMMQLGIFPEATTHSGRPTLMFASPVEGKRTMYATAGGVISFEGQLMILTINHFLPGEISAGKLFPQSHHSSNSGDGSECEITGLEDNDDIGDIEGFVRVTSHVSRNPAPYMNVPDVPDVLGMDTPYSCHDQFTNDRGHAPRASSEAFTRGAATAAPESTEGTPISFSLPVGEVIISSRTLDYSLIRLHPEATQFKDEVPVMLDHKLSFVGTMAQETQIFVRTTSSGLITGLLSGSSICSRLPHSLVFQEVFKAVLEKPLAAGDCGSWVWDRRSRKLLGHIVAGATESAVALIVPARGVFKDILTVLLGTTLGPDHNAETPGSARPHDPPTSSSHLRDLF
ncbi:hypothetical protein HJFPF1_13084 [Paramyrothecium foliicola]|nr:hypothetical protein HJFPF1_13084 [Paramyrothecium foliicola]